jgi:uncharacterized membrane protein (DUF2068 family)
MTPVDNNASEQEAIAETGMVDRRLHRPFSVTLLIVLGLSIVGFNLVRLFQTISQWPYLLSLRSFLPVYLAVSAIAWTIIGLIEVWGLWKGKRWAPSVVIFSFIAWLVYYWFDTLLLTDPAGRSSNIAFIICLQITALALVFGMLASPATTQYFRRNR